LEGIIEVDLPTLSSLFIPDECSSATEAIVSGGETFTYSEFFMRIADFAGAIDQAMASGKKRIVVNSSKCVDAYAVELASAVCGATFCPLNIDAPRGRNERIVSDFGPDLIFTGPGAVTEIDSVVPNITRLLPVTSKLPLAMRRRHSTDVAYVIYTSGTTGYPKGVQITYGNLDWFLSGVLDRLSVRRQSRWSNHPNLAFDLSILDLFGSFASRSTLFPLTSPMERAFPARFIAESGLTVWHSVPSVVENLRRLHAGESGLLRSLEVVILCGEPCRRRWVEYLLEYCAPNVRIFNAYGPTETTVFCMMELVTRGYEFDDGESNVALGTPLLGARLKLDTVDAETSELVICSPGVGIGYLNLRPGERNGYYRNQSGSYYYRTGDLVEQVNDKLYFRGRSDNQVKIRGNRFELSELESSLAATGISGAYAVLVADAVVLFVDSGCRLSSEEIRQAISDQVPSYAVPQAILRLEVLPRNVNDKVDRSALTRLARERIEPRKTESWIHSLS
jgi:D-alanine--poly(phosphoribitol) ligase subunit 1